MARIVLTVTNDLSCDQRMHRIAAALARAGHQVALIGRQLPESMPLSERSYEQQRIRCRFRKGFGFYAEYNIRLWWRLCCMPMDAVGAADVDTLLAACLAAQLRRKPLVFDAHEYFSEVPEVVGRPLVRWCWELIARLCVPMSRQAYTVGPALAAIFSERYGVSFGVVRNMPQAAARPAERPSPPPYVLLYQGALNEGRGIEYLLEAMLHLPDCVLWLAGEGDLSAALRQQAAQHQLGGRVRFLGRLDPAALRQLTPQAWLGLNLFEQKGLNYYYSLANKFFDYVQAGVPVLTMNFPEYRAMQLQYEVALLLDTLSTEAVVAAVKHLQQEPQHYERLRRAAQQARLVWTWEAEEPTLLALWDAALRKG